MLGRGLKTQKSQDMSQSTSELAQGKNFLKKIEGLIPPEKRTFEY